MGQATQGYYAQFIADRVAKGRALLAQIAPPGWAERITAPGLNVASKYACPLARALDMHYDDAAALAFPGSEPVSRNGLAKQYGFFLSVADVDGPEYAALTEAWRASAPRVLS